MERHHKKAIDMGQKDQCMSFLLISKMNEANQRKIKATKKKNFAPISRRDTIKRHRHETKRSVDQLLLDQQNE